MTDEKVQELADKLLNMLNGQIVSYTDGTAEISAEGPAQILEFMSQAHQGGRRAALDELLNIAEDTRGWYDKAIKKASSMSAIRGYQDALIGCNSIYESIKALAEGRGSQHPLDRLRDVLEAEIDWCARNRGSAASPEYEVGFIAGLKQANLFRETLRYNDGE